MRNVLRQGEVDIGVILRCSVVTLGSMKHCQKNDRQKSYVYDYPGCDQRRPVAG